MKMNQNVTNLIETALIGFDSLGYQLDMMGLTSQVNRHTLIGLVMAEQKHLEGELDSIKARVSTAQVKVDRTISVVEGTINNGIDIAMTPARTTINTIKGFLGK
jgi:hypothetical protein